MEQKHKKNVSCSECKRTFKNEIVVWTHIAYEHTNQSSRRSRVFNSAKAQISCSACQKRYYYMFETIDFFPKLVIICRSISKNLNLLTP